MEYAFFNGMAVAVTNGMPEGGACVKQEQKELIRSLRLLGWGYKRIARELKLNRNEVQLFCTTNGLGGPGKFVKLNMPIWNEQNNRCVICGEKLSQKPHGRKRRFCSGKCRTRFYRLRKKEVADCPLEKNT